jgi:hypothetical protein
MAVCQLSRGEVVERIMGRIREVSDETILEELMAV